MKPIDKQRSAVAAGVLAAGLALAGSAFAVTLQQAQSDAGGAEQDSQMRQKTQAGSMKGKMGMMHKGGMFASMDADQDGSVTRDEAAAFHATQFQKWDKDGDGVLTRAESMAGMKAMHASGCCDMPMMSGMMNMEGGEGMCGMMKGMKAPPES